MFFHQFRLLFFFRKSMQLKGYNTKNKYMGLQQSKIDTKNYGKSPCLMGKSTISMAIFNSKLLVYQAG